MRRGFCPLVWMVALYTFRAAAHLQITCEVVYDFNVLNPSIVTAKNHFSTYYLYLVESEL